MYNVFAKNAFSFIVRLLEKLTNLNHNFSQRVRENDDPMHQKIICLSVEYSLLTAK